MTDYGDSVCPCCTVDFGKRYFPRCSNVLNKIVDTKDLLDLADLKNGSQQEQQLKKKRFLEIQDSLKDAFDKDKVEYDQCKANSASSSSASKGLSQRLDKSSKKRKK